MGGKATRVAFGEALLKVAAKNDRVVVINADLGKSTNTVKFVEKYPDRSFNVGVAEANMIGIGAGLALEGWIPFICTFAIFVAGRFETIRVSVAYNHANVKIVGTHAGIGIGEDGYSQMGLEDIALMRSLPNMSVIQPGDAIETERGGEYIVEHTGRGSAPGGHGKTVRGNGRPGGTVQEVRPNKRKSRRRGQKAAEDQVRSA